MSTDETIFERTIEFIQVVVSVYLFVVFGLAISSHLLRSRATKEHNSQRKSRRYWQFIRVKITGKIWLTTEPRWMIAKVMAFNKSKRAWLSIEKKREQHAPSMSLGPDSQEKASFRSDHFPLQDFGRLRHWASWWQGAKANTCIQMIEPSSNVINY